MLSAISNVRKFCYPTTIGMLLILVGCAGTGQSVRTDDVGVAVLGFTERPGVESGVNRAAMGREFGELLEERAGFSVIPHEQVQRKIGAERLAAINARFAERAEFLPTDLQVVMAAGVGARRAVIARLESDAVQGLPPRSESVANRQNGVMKDRERIVLATRRSSRMSVVMFDLQTGRKLWERVYAVEPETSTAYVHYFGSSFSGSLAAALANTMVNGAKLPANPAPPSLRLTLRSLLREAVRNMPTF
jgi:hypothetical protein